MPQSPREVVTRCLRFENPDRLPHDLWTLPWAVERYPGRLAEIARRWPNDIARPAADVYLPSRRRTGDAYTRGTYVDEWGCRFSSVHDGVIGEVREPLIAEPGDWKSVLPPYETLPEDRVAAREEVNRACAADDRFVIASCCPRPWERYQFIRSTVEAMVDIMSPDRAVRDLIGHIQSFYLSELEFWVTTDVDAIMFMDDWGAQSQLLIPPAIWRDLFKPLYREYCDLASSHGKFVFMHSDGHITEIYDELIEIGVNAINSQLFCMDIGWLADVAKGRVTFWGEIDRQHVLPSGDPQVGRDAVQTVARNLYDSAGGVIVQFELGAGANADTAIAILEEWDTVAAERGGPSGA